MKTRIILLLSLIAGSMSCMILPVHAENNAAIAAAQAPRVQQAPSAPLPPALGLGQPQQRGTLYRIHHRGNSAWLYGTIHVGEPGFFPLGSQVTQALSAASGLVLELDVRDNHRFHAALQRYGMYSDSTIDKHLSAEALAQLRTELGRAGIAFEQVSHFKPWVVANLLVGAQLERSGYQRSDGIEFFLLANAPGKAVQELESSEYQMSLFAALSASEQEQYLRENLAELSAGETLRKSRRLINAWSQGDGEAMDSYMRDIRTEKTLSADFMHRVLLDKRNPEMADKITLMLQEQDGNFVGVGLLHLLGENGVPSLLRQRGVEVEKVF